MENGPVIISAETRRREYSTQLLITKLFDPSRCKHMCCREGIDKAPKAPKSSFIFVASVADSSQLPMHVDNNGCGSNSKKLAAPNLSVNEQEVEMEMVDLANGHKLRRFEKLPPKAFKSLYRLHETVTKGRTAPVAIKKQPSFDCIKEKQQQILFPKASARAETSSDKPSTDYDADWMGDLPSPSTLLGKPREKVDNRFEHISTENGSSWRNSLRSPPAFIPHNEPASGNHHYKNSLEGLDLTQFDGDESDIIEPAMVGLSASITAYEDSRVQVATGQASSQADAYLKCLPPPNEATPKVYHSPTVGGKSSGTFRLFFSTDSPEKVVELGQKRKAGIDDQEEDLSDTAPVPKRPRVSQGHEQPPRPSSSAERQTVVPIPVVKPGQPAWVYEFDAAFIAEWQDIVDFV